jgi:hypothetical protein
MKSEPITCAVKDPYAAVAPGEDSAGMASVEAVGRALGYTNKELIPAGDVLNRFVWRRPGELSRKNVNSTEAKALDSPCGRDHAA